MRIPSLVVLFGLGALVCLGLVLDRPPASGERRDGRRPVRYWEKWTGFEEKVMRELVEDFNRSQKEFLVEYLPVSQLERKLMLATVGGQPPDVAGLWSYAVPAYAANGALLPLDDLAAEHGIREEDYLPSIWKSAIWRERLWALPATPATTALYWNKKLFREAGLDPERPPRTLEELERFNEAIARRDGAGRLAVIGHLPEEPGWWLPLWGYWFGGELDDGAGRATALHEGNIAALEWVRSYPERFGKEDLLALRDMSGAFASPQNPFFKGNVAMVLQGPWMENFIANYAPKDFEWGVAAFPARGGNAAGGPVTVVECDVLVIPRGARNVAGAMAFMAWLQRPENMERLCLGQRKFSPLRRVTEDFYARHPNPHIRVFAELAASPNARTHPRLENWAACKSDLQNAYGQVALQLLEPRDALAGVQRRQDIFFEKQLQRAQRRAGESGEARR